jgi:hypothetical protein
MNTLLSSLPLYDSLTMMVSGYLWMLLWTIGINPYLGSHNIFLFCIVCYIVGLVYHRILERLLRSLRNMRCMLEKSHHDINNEFPGIQNLPATRIAYYKAYYRLMRNNCLGNIPVLEAQAAFIRNVIPILAIYLIVLCCGCPSLREMINQTFGSCCIVCAVLFILIVALCFIWYVIQSKIHKLVWEGAYFIKEVIDDEKNNMD